MLHYLHRPDIFLAGDLTVREAITTLDQLNSVIAPKAAEKRGEPWHPYRSYATSYLWGYMWERHPVVLGHFTGAADRTVTHSNQGRGKFRQAVPLGPPFHTYENT